MMKISIETNVGGRVAAPVLDRLLTRIVAVLEKGTGLKFNVKADGNTVRLAHKAKLLRKKASRVMGVVYGANEEGWKVASLDHSNGIVDEYRGTGLSFESNITAAEQKAKEIATSADLNPSYVQNDNDIL